MRQLLLVEHSLNSLESKKQRCKDAQNADINKKYKVRVAVIERIAHRIRKEFSERVENGGIVINTAITITERLVSFSC